MTAAKRNPSRPAEVHDIVTAFARSTEGTAAGVNLTAFARRKGGTAASVDLLQERQPAALRAPPLATLLGATDDAYDAMLLKLKTMGYFTSGRAHSKCSEERTLRVRHPGVVRQLY